MKLIAIDAIDGAGKTTMVKYVVDQLKKRGKRVLQTQEVGNPHVPALKKLREIVLDPNVKFHGASMEFIFAAMGVENGRYYDSVAEDYDYIVSDRSWLSHVAYTDANVSPDFTDDFYLKIVTQLFKKPDYNIFLQIKPDVAWERVTKRGEKADAIEKKGIDFQETVAHAFDVHTRNPELKVITVDANGDVASVQRQLDTFLETLP